MGTYYIAGVGTSSVSIGEADIQIGAVEIKDHTGAQRATVKTAASDAVDTDPALVTADPNLDAKIPALGQGAAAASISVTECSDTTLAKESGGNLATIAGDTTSLDTKVPALGAAASAAAIPVSIATDDSHTGAVGAAADVDGVIHGQLRYIGETNNTMSGKLPAALGAAAAGSSLSTTVDSTEAARLATADWKITRPIYTGTPTIVSYDGSVASAQLSVGLYLICATTDCWYQQGASGVAATTSEFYLPADKDRLLYVDDTTDTGYVAAIKDATAGKLVIMPIAAVA